MAYTYRVAKTYNNRAAFLADIWTDLESMGWSLHDDQSGSSYRVYKSNGENSDRIYEYAKIDYATANTIKIYAYAWWNNSTHAGSSAAYDYTSLTTSETGFTGWIYGSKNFVALMTKIGSTYYRTGFGHFDTKFLTVETDLTAQATSGAHKSLTVTSTTGFIVGAYYQILGSQGEGRDKLQIESITDSTHLVVVNLPRTYNTGARIGQIPSTFGYWNGGNTFFLTCELAVSGTSTCSSDGLGFLNNPLLNISYVDPNARDADFYYLQPLMALEYPTLGFAFYNQNYFLYPPKGANEDVFYVGLQDSGTAESGDATTLTDTNKSWTTNQWAGKVLVITAGTGAGQTRKITSNTATVITVPTWITNPDNTSQYVIADECYRLLNTYMVARESC